MAKKSNKKNSVSLIRKGIAVLASVVTFIFFFLEMIAYKVVGKNILTGKEVTEKTGVKVSDFLFNEDYSKLRETYSTANTILLVVFVLAIVAILATVLGIVMKKGTMFSKIGAALLVIAMLLMFVINVDKTELITTNSYTNMTTLYFIALALSVGGLVSVATLKD